MHSDITGPLGSFGASFTVPLSTALGAHTVTAIDAKGNSAILLSM
jgi:hypothetical protein